ncbi:hypothetical protein FHW88_003349 [Mucilaginibacter sp. SG538B]|uniref:hypothetical protein n=1 Tax=Mucilaginibacter sp. SG538B TaxID=2587021 RepID=UPI00159DEC18|nr:hypothetical protein [Mucilaginibacter sp. SG538B]NVM65045.1 hypothetical protein [Mucilaginibacter sp. SG538B]
MKTTVIENQSAKNNKSAKNNNRPNITGKEAKNETNNDEGKNAGSENEPAPQTGNTEVKAGDPATVDNQPANVAGTTEAGQIKPEDQNHPQGEPTKRELKELFSLKPFFNLDATVKLVGDLSKKIAQRDRLKGTIDNLETFTIQANEDGDVTGNNKFYRCELIIRDDNGNEFVTKNAYIIDHVSQYVNSLCVEKLAEIEAEIIIPA